MVIWHITVWLSADLPRFFRTVCSSVIFSCKAWCFTLKFRRTDCGKKYISIKYFFKRVSIPAFVSWSVVAASYMTELSSFRSRSEPVDTSGLQDFEALIYTAVEIQKYFLIAFCGCLFVLTAAPLMLHFVKILWSFLFSSSMPCLLLEIFLQTCSLSDFHFWAGELINLMQFWFSVSKSFTTSWSSEEIWVYFGNTAVSTNYKPYKWKFWSNHSEEF